MNILTTIAYVIVFLRVVSSCKQTCSCRCSKGVADCSFMNLNSIPDISENTFHLILSGNRLNELGNGDLSITNISVITKLDLDRNFLSQIPPTVLRYIPLLKEISLDSNDFETFPEQALLNVNASLRKISLKYNRLTSLTSTMASNFKNLVYFDGRGNCFDSIDDVYLAIPDVQVLFLGAQSSLCPTPGMSTNGRLLGDWKNLVIFGYTGTTSGVRGIDGSFFRSIPKSLLDLRLRNLTSLSEISFYGSQLQSAHLENIAGRPLLKDFDSLCRTLISVVIIDSIFSDVNYLFNASSGCVTQTIYIENSTNVFKGNWPAFTQLSNLSLIGNELGSISESALPSIDDSILQFLNISSNAIKTIDSEDFKQHSSLITLDMQNNRLEIIDGLSFYYLHSLIHLDLSHNMIGDMRAELKLASVVFIGLAGNRIQEIPPDFFSKCPKLKYLDLSHNQLSLLGTISGMENSQLAIVGNGNPWLCDRNFTISYDAIVTRKTIDFSCGSNFNLTYPSYLSNWETTRDVIADSDLCFSCTSLDYTRQLDANLNTTSTTYSTTTTTQPNLTLIISVTVTAAVVVLTLLFAMIILCLKRGKKCWKKNEAPTDSMPAEIQSSDRKQKIELRSVAVRKTSTLTNLPSVSAFSKLNSSQYLRKFMSMPRTPQQETHVHDENQQQTHQYNNQAFEYYHHGTELDDRSNSCEESNAIDGYLSFTPPLPDDDDDVFPDGNGRTSRMHPMSNSLYLTPVITARSDTAMDGNQDHIYIN